MDYLKELDYLIEKFGNHNELIEKLLSIKDFCVISINEINYLRNQLEDKQSDEDSEEVYSYEEFQELKAFAEATKQEIIETKNKYEMLNTELEELEIQLEISDVKVLELNNQLNILEEASIVNFPVSDKIYIGSAKRISDESTQKNDGYNKILIFETFEFQTLNKGFWTKTKQQSMFYLSSKIEKRKETNYKSLFNDSDKRYVIITDSSIHQLITGNRLFQEFISNVNRKRMFTFIEFNESYAIKHAKNFNYNSDQVAAVLLPYIWKQLPIINRINMNNFIKIVTIFKFNNNGIIADEFRFFIIYKESNGILKYHEIDRNIKFITNVKFNFIEQNLYCDSLKTFDDMEKINDNKLEIQQHIKDNLKQAWNNEVVGYIHEIVNNGSGTYKIEYKFDFNFNQTITSDNLPQLFLALKYYCRFEIINKSQMKRMTENVSRLFSKDHNDKILNHYVTDFIKEEYDKLDLKQLSGPIEPDMVIVSY